ncbi:MAG: hypothetical protein HQM14_21705 [SAR324 cluster bacterium]|nr:hypothetical protein [SAR324 cluster bacterium]
MVKKRSKRKISITRKQKTNKNPPEIKISEAIWKLSDPLIRQYRETHRIQSIISITIIAWNFSLFHEDEHDRLQGLISNAYAKAIHGDDTEVLVKCIDTLIKRKKTMYPNINEYIVEYDLSFTDEGAHLSVGTSSVDEKINKKAK